MADPRSPPPTRPDPDPTVLTTAALLREISRMEQLFDAKLTALVKEIINTDALIDARLKVIDARYGEQFRSIGGQFVERDTRVEQTAKAGAEALSAALQAAKEAVGEQTKSFVLSTAKAEAATTEQIKQQGVVIAATNLGFSTSINDMKDRITRIESATLALASANSAAAAASQDVTINKRASISNTAAIVAIAVALILGLLSISIGLLRGH
jgi:hypothetical protein